MSSLYRDMKGSRRHGTSLKCIVNLDYMNTLNKITMKYKYGTFSDVVISCCCKRLRSFPLKHRIFYPKQILSARNHCYKFKMNDTSEVNGSLKNESQFARSFPSKADGIVLCSAYLFSSALIITGNLFALVLFAVTRVFL